MITRTTPTDLRNAAQPSCTERPLVILQGRAPNGAPASMALYFDSHAEAREAVAAFTDEGWTFTRREVQA